MARSDGSIVINTSLDNSGFEKNSKELVAAIKGLTDSINQMGQTLQSTFSNYTKSIQDAVAKAGQLQSATTQAKEDVAGLGSATDETRQSLEQLEAEGQKAIIDFDTPKQKATTLEKEIDKLGKSVNSLDSVADKAASGNEQATEKLRTGYAEAEKSLESLKQKTANLGSAKLPTEDYKWLCDEIAKVDKQLEKYENRQAKLKAVGASENSQGWKSLQYDIDMARANLEDLRREKAEMEAEGTAFTSGADTEQYQQASQQLDQISQKLSEIQQKSASALQPPDTQGLQQEVTLTGQLRSGFERIAQGAANAFDTISQKAMSVGAGMANAFQHPISSILGGLNRLAGKAVQTAGSMMRIAGSGSGIVSGLKKVASGATSAAKNLAKMAGRSILSGIRRVTSAITRLGSATKNSGGGFAGGLKSMLKYGLGVRSLFALINKLRSALTEGMQNLAQADPEFNAVMSNFIGSLKLLGNAFATAFAPIAEYVLPVLTTLINALTEVISRIGMLFASLTGKGTFTKATGYQYDYAKATGNASDAAEDEAEANEELQKTLAGFDDVEILKEDKQKDSKLDKGANAPSTFEEVPIENTMSDLAQMIKDMWEKQDFSDLGRMLGEKIRDALNKIPWDEIKEQLRKIAKCIATFLNGFLETPGLFEAIGKTLAEALNSAFEFLKSFAENFHWGSLGTAIKEGILGCLNNIDWDLIKETMGLYGSGIAQALTSAFDNPEIWTAIFTTLAEGLNSVVALLNNFFTGINWASLATNIGTGLNAGIEAIDWAGIAQLLCNMINGVFDAWYSFFTTVDWYRFGELVGTSISTVLNGVDWAKGGASVAATINALFYALNGFIEHTDWEQLGRAVIDIIGGFFAELDWGAIGKNLSNVWVALFDFLSGALDKVDWEKLPEDICTDVGEFLAGFDWTSFCESLGKLLGSAFKALIGLGKRLWKALMDFGRDVIEGGWEGMKDKMKSFGTWLNEHIFKPFIDGFKKAFGIASPAKEMMPLGEYIIEGLLEGIKGMFHIITDFFGTCGRKISNVWDGLTGWWENIGSNLVIGIWNGICGAWDWLCDSVWNLADNLWGNVCNFFGINSPSRLARDTMKWLPIGMAQGVEQTADQAIDSVMDLAQAMQDEASVNPVMAVDTAFMDGTDGLENVLTSFSDKVIAGFDNLISSMDRIAQQAGFGFPAMAYGTVTPYASGSGSSGSAVQDMVDALNAQDNVTRDDLNYLISELSRKIDGISFMIGDEQLARHANKGNERLNRRYKTFE